MLDNGNLITLPSLAGRQVTMLCPCHECLRVLKICRHTCLCINSLNLSEHKWPYFAEANLYISIVIMATISQTHEFTDVVGAT